MKHLLLSCLFLFCFNLNFAQEKFTLSGTISNQENNETLIGVNVIFPELKTGTVTNEYGFYSITLPAGTYNLAISYLGFSDINQTITLDKNITLDFKLTESVESLDEVVIKENIEQLNIQKAQMSVNTLTASTIKQIPVVLGEADVLKAITLLPGVTNAG